MPSLVLTRRRLGAGCLRRGSVGVVVAVGYGGGGGGYVVGSVRKNWSKASAGVSWCVVASQSWWWWLPCDLASSVLHYEAVLL